MEEAIKAEDSIISATWDSPYSLNENYGGCFSEEVCRDNGRKAVEEGLGIHSPRLKESEKYKEMLSDNGKKNGISAGKKNGPDNGKKNGKRNGERTFREGRGLYDPNHKEKVVDAARKNGKDKATPVTCLELGTSFPSTMEAERETHIPSGNISRSARSNGKKKAGGYHWIYTNQSLIQQGKL